MKDLQKLLNEIKKHNDKVYENYSPTKKIDFSKCNKNWGTDVIPEKYWVSRDKKYATKQGYRVELHEIVLTSNGKEMTYPVKGTMYLPRKGKKDEMVYSIWTLDGRNDIINDSKFNLVEVK